MSPATIGGALETMKHGNFYMGVKDTPLILAATYPKDPQYKY